MVAKTSSLKIPLCKTHGDSHVWLCRRTIYDDPFIRNYIEDLLKNIRTQVPVQPCMQSCEKGCTSCMRACPHQLLHLALWHS